MCNKSTGLGCKKASGVGDKDHGSIQKNAAPGSNRLGINRRSFRLLGKTFDAQGKVRKGRLMEKDGLGAKVKRDEAKH